MPMVSDTLVQDTLLDAVATPLLVVSADNTILFTNRLAREWFGMDCAGQSLNQWIDRSATASPAALRLKTPVERWVQMTTAAFPFHGQSAQLVTLVEQSAVPPEIVQRYEALVEYGPELIVITDETERIVYANDTVLRHIGYTRDELYALSSRELVHPADLPRLIEALVPALSSRTQAQVELRVRNRQGEYRWFETIVGQHYEETSQKLQIVSVARDIDAWKQAEINRKQNEERLALVTDYGNDLIVQLGTDGTVQYVTPSVLKVAGYPAEDVIGTSPFALIHPDDLATVQKKFQGVLEGRPPHYIEFRLRHANGQYIWVELNAELFYEEDSGELQFLALTMHDVSVRKRAEEALRTNREHLRLLMDNSMDVILQISPDGIIQYASPASQRLIGYSPLELLGASPFQYLHADYTSIARQSIQAALETRKPQYLEFLFRHQTGRYIWLELMGQAIVDKESDAVSSVVVSIRDIEARKRAELALRESEARYRLIADSISDIIGLHQPDGTLLYVSPSITRVTGWLPEDLIGKPAFALIHPDELPSVVADMTAQLKTQPTATVEYRCRCKDDSYVWIEVSVRMTEGAEGEPRQMVSVARNISARKEQEQLRRQSEERYRLLAENINDMIALRDVSGNNIYISPSAERLLGYSVDQLLAMRPGQLVHPDDVALSQQQYALVMQEPYATRYEFRATHCDGQLVWMESSVRAIRDAGGEITHVITASRDITERKRAEEALRASETMLKRITETIPVEIYIFDYELDRDVFQNRVNQLGYPPHIIEQAGSGFYYSLMHPDDLAGYLPAIERFRIGNAEEAFEFEYRMRHADGHYRWFACKNVIFMTRPDGSARQVLGTVQDITERKAVEDALRHSEEQYRLLADSISDVIGLYELSGTVAFITPSITQLTGYEPSELIGNSPFSMVAPDDLGGMVEQLTTGLTVGQQVATEYRIIRKDGSFVWVETLSRLLDGTPSRAIAITRNIQARKEAEEALRQKEEQLRNLMDNIHDMVAQVDKDLRYIYVSPSHTALLGYSPGELIDQPILDMLHPDDAALLQPRLFSVTESTNTDISEFRFRHADGYYVWLEATRRVLLNEAGRFDGIVFTARDISERRWMQRALVEQERLLVSLQKEQELSELKTSMMRRLSHELRTPLAIISTSADLLENYGHRMVESQRRDRLQQIKNQIKQFTDMLDNMSLVVRGIMFSSDFAASPCDLEALCQEIVSEVTNTLKLNHEVQLSFSGETRAVLTNPQLIRLILVNLLSNALKYSPLDSTVTIQVAHLDQAIRLVVSDHGVGIPDEDRERIYEPFYRGKNIGEVPGLGIGLSIVQKAVESARGIIEIVSEVGQGTTVTVSIPPETSKDDEKSSPTATTISTR